jgi:hypothetical protein
MEYLARWYHFTQDAVYIIEAEKSIVRIPI